MSYDMVCRWKKKSDSGLESTENALKSGRPKSASSDKIVSKAELENWKLPIGPVIFSRIYGVCRVEIYVFSITIVKEFPYCNFKMQDAALL